MSKTTITREEIAQRFIEANFLDLQKITVLPGDFKNPGYCHINARQALEMGVVSSVALVVYLRRGFLRIHWLEVDEGIYRDNTLGYLSRENEYFLIKTYTKDELANTQMNEVNDNAKRDFLSRLYSKEELETMEFDLLDL